MWLEPRVAWPVWASARKQNRKMSTRLCFVHSLSNMCSIFNPSCVYLENSLWAAVCMRVPVGISEETDTGAAREGGAFKGRHGNAADTPQAEMAEFVFNPIWNCTWWPTSHGGRLTSNEKQSTKCSPDGLSTPKLLGFFSISRGGQSQSSSRNSYQTLTFVMRQSSYNAETVCICICNYTLSDCQGPTVLQKLYY